MSPRTRNAHNKHTFVIPQITVMFDLVVTADIQDGTTDITHAYIDGTNIDLEPHIDEVVREELYDAVEEARWQA